MTDRERYRDTSAEKRIAEAFEQDRKMIGLVGGLPTTNDAERELLLEAAGSVQQELDIIEKHAITLAQLTTGVSTEQLDSAIARVTSLHPADETATTHREVVLKGLHQLQDATRVMNSIGRDPSKTGMAAYQIGFSVSSIDATIAHVTALKELIEETQKPINIPSHVQNVPRQAITGDRSISTPPAVENQPPLTHEIFAKPTTPKDANDAVKPKRDSASSPLPSSETTASPALTERQKEILQLNRGRLGKIGSLGARTVLHGIDLTKEVLDWKDIDRLRKRGMFVAGAGGLLGIGTGAFGLKQAIEVFTPPPPTEDELKEADETYIREHSLTETPSVLDNRRWYTRYPSIADDEEFVDLFDGTFRQIFYAAEQIPLFNKQGDNNPTPTHNESPNSSGPHMRLKISDSDFREPLVYIQITDGGNHGWGNPWDNQPTVVVSGRVTPDVPQKRRYPNIVQFTHISTQETYYLQLTPIQAFDSRGNLLFQDNGKPQLVTEIRYMKKKKKASL